MLHILAFAWATLGFGLLGFWSGFTKDDARYSKKEELEGRIFWTLLSCFGMAAVNAAFGLFAGIVSTTEQALLVLGLRQLANVLSLELNFLAAALAQILLFSVTSYTFGTSWAIGYRLGCRAAAKYVRPTPQLARARARVLLRNRVKQVERVQEKKQISKDKQVVMLQVVSK